jgi:hypothetical protein
METMAATWLAAQWVLIPLFVGVYCLIQAVHDFRRRNYFLAMLGGVCVVLLWLVPIESNVIKLDLPVNEPG